MIFIPHLVVLPKDLPAVTFWPLRNGQSILRTRAVTLTPFRPFGAVPCALDVFEEIYLSRVIVSYTCVYNLAVYINVYDGFHK